ncbi:MAG TPA: hypothetical protein DEH02_07805 [Bacteroidales bacterium]|nr:MAG: hypothetical protein A2X01_04645 [Bacteroidetes bacterium GWF2_35_48]HBX50953.1 hypothetical protein [Bacteroidales bacterium]
MCVANENVIYYSIYYPTYNKSQLLKTIDGGVTWTDINFFNTENFIISSMFALNKDTLYVAISENNIIKILKTKNGGFTWETEYLSNNYGVKNLFYINENLGFCTLGKYILRYTGSSSIEKDYSEEMQVSITPNPTTNKLNIAFNTEINTPFQIQLIEIASGKIVLQESSNTQNFRINMEKLPSSVYILRIFNEKFVFNNRIIKQ